MPSPFWAAANRLIATSDPGALTHRLGVSIPKDDRHSAIGDTVATAHAVLKLVPILQGKGLATVGEVLAEVRKHG